MTPPLTVCSVFIAAPPNTLMTLYLSPVLVYLLALGKLPYVDSLHRGYTTIMIDPGFVALTPLPQFLHILDYQEIVSFSPGCLARVCLLNFFMTPRTSLRLLTHRKPTHPEVPSEG